MKSKACSNSSRLPIFGLLARVAVGKDENSARDMGEIVAAAEALRRSFDASILLIHHTRKDGGSERGSSAFPARRT